MLGNAATSPPSGAGLVSVSFRTGRSQTIQLPFKPTRASDSPQTHPLMLGARCRELWWCAPHGGVLVAARFVRVSPRLSVSVGVLWSGTRFRRLPAQEGSLPGSTQHRDSQ